jgi:outer membrane protein assembly factor BamB
MAPETARAVPTILAESPKVRTGGQSSWNVTCRSLLLLSLAVAVGTAAHAQAGALAASSATAAWTVKVKGDIHWQQVTPAGALLVSTDAGLAGVDIERGQVAWEKPELAGLPADSVRMVEGSLLMEAARPGSGLLVIFDPVTGAVVFDSRRLNLTQVVTRRVLPQTGTLLVHGRRARGGEAGGGGGAPSVVALYDLVTGEQRWANDTLFEQGEPKKKGLGGLMQGLVRAAAEGTALEVLQAGPEMIVVHTLTGLRAMDARTGAVRWSATLPTARKGVPAQHVRLYPSLNNPDRMYVSFDDRLMAYRLADGQALWAKPPTVEGWVHGIVEHPGGIIILPESPPADQATGNVRIVNGVVQTGLNVARYEDGTTIAAKPLRMRGTVREAIITGGSAVLAVDAESRTFVNVLDVATATLRLKKDVKIKGQLDYAELTPAGLLYISRPDAATNAEVNIIDLSTGGQKFKDAIESGKPLSSGDYKAARYYLHHAVEGRTLYVFANRDHRLYAVDRDAGTFRALGGEIKLQGGEDPIDMEIRPSGIVLIAPQNLVIVSREGQVQEQIYHPAPQLPGLLRALYRVNAVRAGLYGAAASAYGDAFAQASRQAKDPTARRITGELATAYSQGGAQLAGYSRQAAALATKRFKASLAVPGSVFMLTRAPEGHGNVLLQVDKDSGQPRTRVDLGKEREPVYAVDDVAGMLFLQTTPGTLVGYRL